ncbi:ANTAR domain-containing protein [Leeia sp. TBRC 13508]|uniref:ANTAR domain-containing protein n=1 Tax=Leeia speluncae TaxID=2884804 RepID=A0ABS8D1Z8_9NEIS|nr:ANTAR domain-containing protein [Leeia speluncae]MCB6182200.1 ANTAR domain-containing protein [Leeia speluncae]
MKPSILIVNDTNRPMDAARHALEAAGYEVIDEVDSAKALLHAVSIRMPDVVIIDTNSPSRDTLEQLSVMHTEAPRPVVMFSNEADRDTIRKAVAAGVSAYIVDGLSTERLAPILEVAKAQFEQKHEMAVRLANAEQQLADRKLIEKAKGILMARKGLSEQEAFEQLRSLSMKQGQKLVDLARQLVSMADLL